MNRSLLIVVGLVVLDIPLYVLLFRALFRGPRRRGDSDSAVAADAPVRRPRLADFLDPEYMKDEGGEMKVLLFLFTAALLVLVEYALVLHYLPGLLPGLPKPRA